MSDVIPHVIFLPLSQGKYAQVDSDCREEIWNSKWYCGAGGYVRRHAKNNSNASLAHCVLELPTKGSSRNGTEIDHKNHDKLDNLRSNLRSCSTLQNRQSKRKTVRVCSSTFKGVHRRPSGRWLARLRTQGEDYLLGTFENEEDAARAYNEAAKKYFGEFEQLNQV